MNVPEINEVKDILQNLKENNVIREWELPYENLLTRRTAAIFFFSPVNDGDLQVVTTKLGSIPQFSFRLNTEKKLSNLQYRLTFNEEEKLKNENNTAVTA